MPLTRRGLLGFTPLLVAAPAIVRASSLMPVKSWETPSDLRLMEPIPPGTYTFVLDHTEARGSYFTFRARVGEVTKVVDMPKFGWDIGCEI